VSWDLLVVSTRRPTHAMLRPALQRHPELLTVSGDLDAGEGIEITTTAGEPRLLAGPADPVRLDEVKDVLARTGNHAMDPYFGSVDVWWLDLEVPAAGAGPGLALARLCATHLAEQSRGVVIDLHDPDHAET
jgi:hypothetical protein